MADNLPNIELSSTTPASEKEFNKDILGPIAKWKRITLTTGPTPKPRHGHRSVAIKDLMIVFGGGNEGIVDQLHVYNTVTNKWFLPAVRGDIPQGCAAYGIACDMFRIFIFGGMVEYGRYSNDLFELQTRRWEWRRIRARLPRNGLNGPCPRLGHSFTISESDHICYVFGGLANDGVEQGQNVARYLNDLYTIDLKPTTTIFQWECPATIGVSPSPRESHSAVYYEANGKKQLIIFGGMVGTRLGDLWILDLYSLTWDNPQIHGIPPIPRSLHTANIINNKMYVFGGWVPVLIDECFDNMEKEWQCTNSLGIFNVETLTWEYLSNTTLDESDSLPSPRAGHSSVVINKRIYVWSGRDGYRKMIEDQTNPQMCCNSMYFLETDVPPAPSQIQLMRASINGLELTWNPVSNSEKYLLQIQKYIPTLEPAQNQRGFVRAQPGPTVKMIPVQRNGTPMMKLIRNNPNPLRTNQQVLRVVPASKNSLGLGQAKIPMQKTIIVSKAVVGGTSQQSSLQSNLMVQENVMNNGNDLVGSSKLVFVQPNAKQSQLVQQQNLQDCQQISYPSEHLHQSYVDVVGVSPHSQSYDNSHMTPVQSAISQSQFTGPTTTYTTPVASCIDQSMPHDILDEALNDAENYEPPRENLRAVGTSFISTPQNNALNINSTSFIKDHIEPKPELEEKALLSENIAEIQGKIKEEDIKVEDDIQIKKIKDPLQAAMAEIDTQDLTVKSEESTTCKVVYGSSASSSIETFKQQSESLQTQLSETRGQQASDASLGNPPTEKFYKESNSLTLQNSQPIENIPREYDNQYLSNVSPIKPQEILEADFQAQERANQSPTALQDPSTISLHSTDFEQTTQTPSPLPAPSNVDNSQEILKQKLPVPVKVVPRFEAKDLWYDVGYFSDNKCLVTHYNIPINNINPPPNQELDSEVYEQGVRKIELEPGTIYKFRVSAINGCGQGPYCTPIGFKTCLPGFPGAPSSIKISKGNEGAQLTWEPPQNSNGRITEYSVYLAIRNYNQDPQCAFVRVYVGMEPRCSVSNNNLHQAYIDNSPKPAIIFRIAAKNEKGYGPATQVRWLQDSRPANTTPIHHAPVPMRRPTEVYVPNRIVGNLAINPNQIQASNYITKRMRLE